MPNFSLTQADGEKSLVAKTEAQKNGKSDVSIENENLPIKVLESASTAQHEKSAEDIEGAENAVGGKETKNIRHKKKEEMTAEELEEMKKRKRQKKSEKKKQKEAQKNEKSGVSIEDGNLPKMGEIFLGVLF